MVIRKQAMARARDNHSLLIVRNKNRSQNDGESTTVQYYQCNFDFQLSTIILQWSALFMGEWIFKYFIRTIITTLRLKYIKYKIY